MGEGVLNPAQIVVATLVVSLAQIEGTIRGELAHGAASLCHGVKLDSPLQWGNAYFRCPNAACGQARDCDEKDGYNCGYESICLECDEDLTLPDLIISEGWVLSLPRLLATEAS